MPTAAHIEWPSLELQRVPMSFEEYLELPEEIRAEWVEGVAIVSPMASFPHQRIAADLMVVLRTALPDLIVVVEAGVRTAGRKYRIPDLVAVVRPPEDPNWVEEPPVLVVEVLSPSTRREDQLRKSGEYLAAGIGQYWVVDPELRELVVLAAADDGWATMLELDETRPNGTVRVGDHGTVVVDLPSLLAD